MSTPDKYLIIIAGPTAIGKTQTAINLAKWMKCPIISADSRQFYRETTIGTAKPSKKELETTHHYFIDHLSIEDEYSAGDFERDCIQFLSKIFEHHDYCIMCGGSGLYIRAVEHGLNKFPSISEEVDLKWEELYKKNGLAALQKYIANQDPEYFENVDIQNPRRLLRALKVMDMSNETFSSLLARPTTKRSFHTKKILLELPREELYRRINIRVDRMMDSGLLKEAESLFSKRHLRSLETVGYSELFEHLEGSYNLEEAIELIKRNSRRYAKRQMTWFRNDEGWNRFNPSDLSGIKDFLTPILND